MKKNELMHFGVPGMRWGVRRGRSLVSKKPKPPKASELSDDELKRRITRLERENNYKRLTGGNMDRAKKIVGGILIGVATAKVSQLISKGLDTGASKIGKAVVAKFLKFKKG
jgi:hypothetical protein